ncbi:MAG: sigma-E factor negative regulatory protein [Gammaproteobacteria bacterium]
MTDTLHEQLSALVDDELCESEQALLIRQLGRDANLRNRLARYQVISDTLRSNLPHGVDTGFYRRVHAALEQEAEIHAAQSRVMPLFKPVAGLALAASVAVVAVVSLQSVRQQDPAGAPAIASAPGVNDYIRANNIPPPVVPRNSARGLEAYLVNHNEYAVNRGMQGMLPYMRIVGRDLQPGSSEDTEK